MIMDRICISEESEMAGDAIYSVEDESDLSDPISGLTEQEARDESEAMADAVEYETGTRPEVIWL